MIFLGLVAVLFLSVVHPFFFTFAAISFAFFVPGFAIVKRLKVEGEGTFLLALSVVLSVLVSTQAVYWVSQAIGYGQASILISFALMAALAYKIDWKLLPKLDAAPLAAACGFFLLMYALFATTLWVPSSQGVIVGGWNWSDLFAHLPIIQSVNHGNFPPQTPFFAGVPLDYHWFADFHTAFLAKASSLPAVDWIRFENALYNGLLVLALWALASRFVKKEAVPLAVVLVVFGGSFAFVHFLSDFSENPTLDLIRQNAYDNDWKFFQVPSLIGGFLSVQRPQMIGLPALALALTLLLDGFSRRRNFLLLSGSMIALMAPFQYFAFGAALVLGSLYIAYASLKQREVNAPAVAAFFAPMFLAVPFLMRALEVGKSAGFLHLSFGWLAPKEPLDFFAFYIANFGLPFILALAAFAFSKTEKKEVLALWTAALFAIPNVVTLSGTQWDMTKFFAFMTIPAGILAASWLAKQHNAIKFAALAISFMTSVLFLAWAFQSTWIGLLTPELAAGAWIENNTPELSVFAAFPVHNSPIDSVAGRLRLTGYSSWMANYGLSYAARENALDNIYCSSAENAFQQASRLNVTYVYLGGNEKSKYACQYLFTKNAGLFKKVYEAGGIQIYEVKKT